MRTLLIVIAVTLYSMASAFAGNLTYQIPNSERLVIKAPVYNEDHELLVILPNTYKAESKRMYPVLYFLDAHWDYAMLYGLYEQMRIDNILPEMILVGLSYPGNNDDYMRRRFEDYTPVKDEILPNSGGAKKYLSYLRNTVVKKIESDYRADPQDKTLAGHSLGGLFVLNAMYSNPTFFTRYMALSPSAITGGEYLMKLDSQYAKGSDALPTKLFLSYGDEEYSMYRDAIIKYEKQLQARAYKNLGYHYLALPGMRHTSVKTDGYLHGLTWTFNDIAPAEPSAFASFLDSVYKKQ